MSVIKQFRTRLRLFRLYYRSRPLFSEALANPGRAFWFPFLGAGVFRARSDGRALTVPREYWTMLPTACRLLLLGANSAWRGQELHIEYQGYQFVVPPTQKSAAIFLKEVFKDDVYRIAGENLSGQVVLDVGANIGDTSIAFAARGAHVHAFEPMPLLLGCLRRNIELNHFGDRITVHTVGLSDRDETIRIKVDARDSVGYSAVDVKQGRPVRGETIQEMALVNALPYLERQGLRTVDVLKLDCEGCEYELLKTRELLDFLKPARVILEYHQGGEKIVRALERDGYQVDWPDRSATVGYVFAARLAPRSRNAP